ncbi:SMI1/KNR4 family protein [uncultured Gimesia sp.]|uniref:SMI1/KNR4 family protein n=1 Tax=uncultured Gimesia sp. TaxID=1678688 RepID=UPI0030D884CD|tara:strand:+ start:81029 stop:81439 length:411 start_codon:yes stop_codon:yes gene_type:complete
MTTPKLNLPEKYLKWLDGIDEDAYLEIEDWQWALAGRKELLQTIEINEDETIWIDQARLLVKIIEEVAEESGTEENEIPFARIAGWLTIGGNEENLLCVDPADKYSVWVFYINEGGDVEKIANSLDELMEEAEQVN